MLRRGLLTVLIGLSAWILADRLVSEAGGDSLADSSSTATLTAPTPEPDEPERWWDARRHVSPSQSDAGRHAALQPVAIIGSRAGAGPAARRAALTQPPAAHASPHLLDIPLLI